jgi:pimeloyl-ACP methyl ester carboxylesterase
MNPSRIKRFYADVPEDQIKRLLDFRERYPYQTAAIQGVSWRYIDTGGDGPVIFIFAGGTNIAELSFQTLGHLARRYRVIAPDYPPIRTLAELFRGALGLLDQLGVGQFHLMGGSYGGWMAQSFVRYCPDRVKTLVLAAIGPPNPENSRQIEKLLFFLRLLPAPLLRKLMLKTLSSLVKPDQQPGMELMVAHLKEILYEHMGRADILASMERLVDQTSNYTFTPHDLDVWPGKILYIAGSEDSTSTPEKREAMLALYPQAQIHIIQGAGHAAAISHQQEYFDTIDAFLAE